MRLSERGAKAQVYLRHYFASKIGEHEPLPEQTRDRFAHVAKCEIQEMPNQKLLRYDGETRKQALMRLEVAAKEKLLREKLRDGWQIIAAYYTPNRFGRTPSLRRLSSRYYYHHTQLGRIITKSLNEAGEILFRDN